MIPPTTIVLCVDVSAATGWVQVALPEGYWWVEVQYLRRASRREVKARLKPEIEQVPYHLTG